MQGDIFQIGVEKNNSAEVASGIISLLHMYRGQTIKNGVTSCSANPPSEAAVVFIIYLSHLCKWEGLRTDLKAYLIIYDIKQSHP